MSLHIGKLNIQANEARIFGIEEDANQQGIKMNEQIETWKGNREYLCLM